MKLQLATYIFASSMAGMIFSQATGPGPEVISQAYAYKDLTVSGLLFGAVIFLYRELNRERKLRETLAVDTKMFIEAQTKAVKDATESQNAAMGQVAEALLSLQNTSQAQTAIYNAHINTLVQAAARNISDR